MIRNLHSLTVAILPLLLLVSSCALGAQSKEFGPGRRAGIVQNDLICEASGIVASRRSPGVLWVHNDSGDSARVFAINERGDLLGVCTVAGATARDWEDIAVGPGPDPNQQYLYIGDIGDNQARYAGVTVYRVPEPKVNPTSTFGQMRIGPADAIRLTYPDGPRDAETLLVDPLTRDIFIISKRELFSKVYRAVWPQSTTQPTEMTHVATLPWGFAVAGDVSPDGRRVVVRSMFNASLWVRPLGMDEAPRTRGEARAPASHASQAPSAPVPLWHAFSGRQVQLPLMKEPQGEGICFDAAGLGYFTIGEMRHPPLHYFGPIEPNTPRPATTP